MKNDLVFNWTQKKGPEYLIFGEKKEKVKKKKKILETPGREREIAGMWSGRSASRPRRFASQVAEIDAIWTNASAEKWTIRRRLKIDESVKSNRNPNFLKYFLKSQHLL